jgi:four helix bundle protein
MNPTELKTRTFQFSLRIIELVRALPKTTEARAIGSQIIRSGTAIGANYRASCKARSRAEFIAKIGVVEEETNETAYWLELIISSKMLPESRLKSLLDETHELERIFGTSRLTAQRNAPTKPQKTSRPIKSTQS